ncbi:unnamed protein product [Notodromas monacha]|uniref:Uncharacterized protein n=1 Tax=Notodromas monacha TaxID=399045 RepID=A0A7R9BSM4_9CRUS|nr:unnamed protein product [Notodromas monacha]CAG0920978.1 unnamed protein product [Notodromas monacha]
MEEDGSAVSMESRLEAANMCQRVLAKMLENNVGGIIGKRDTCPGWWALPTLLSYLTRYVKVSYSSFLSFGHINPHAFIWFARDDAAAILFAVTIMAGDPLRETLLCPGQGPMWKDDGTAVEGKPPNSNHRHFVRQCYRPCLFDAVGKVEFGGKGIKANLFDKCESQLDGGYDETFATDLVVSVTRQRGKDGQFIPGDVVIVKATGVEKVVAVVHQKSYWVVGLGG